VTVTAQRVGANKPGWPNFRTALADLKAPRIPPARVLYVGQSLRADITPGNRLGLRSARVHRPGRLLGLSGEGAAETRTDMEVSSLAELVAALAW